MVIKTSFEGTKNLCRIELLKLPSRYSGRIPSGKLLSAFENFVCFKRGSRNKFTMEANPTHRTALTRNCNSVRAMGWLKVLKMALDRLLEIDDVTYHIEQIMVILRSTSGKYPCILLGNSCVNLF